MKQILEIINSFKKILNKNEIYKTKKILFLLFISLILETISISSLIPLMGFIAAPDIFILKAEQMNFLSDPIKNLFDKKEDQFTILLYLSFFTLIIFGIKNLSIILINGYKERFFAKLTVNLSSRIYSSYLKSDYQFYLKNNSAKIIRNLVTEVPIVINLLNLIFFSVLD